jgi:hypothetical protein
MKMEQGSKLSFSARAIPARMEFIGVAGAGSHKGERLHFFG